MFRDDLSARLAHHDRAVGARSFSVSQHSKIFRNVLPISKRIFDVVFALILLPIVLLFVAIMSGYLLIRIGRPIFFVHKRVGKFGREFGCIKFRTMQIDAENALKKYLAENPEAMEEWTNTQKLEKDPRVLPGIGKILRTTSLDELPQLLNVLKGEMSFVGPRPVTVEEIERYGPDAVYYMAVTPGITGKWQVNGRTDLTYEERVQLDVEYVKGWSLLGDCFLIAKTAIVVLKREGAV